MFHEWGKTSGKYEGERGKTDKTWDSLGKSGAEPKRLGSLVELVLRERGPDALNEYWDIVAQATADFDGPAEEFESVFDTKPDQSPPFEAKGFSADMFKTIRPARPWLYHGLLLRSEVTVLSGPGGTGKSSIILAALMGLAVGR